MPLIGWSMLSAGGYPIVLYGPIHLPQIMPHNDALYAVLRSAHTWLAYLFFATILLHVAAALFHALVRHDSVFRSMASWRTGSGSRHMPAADATWTGTPPINAEKMSSRRRDAAE